MPYQIIYDKTYEETHSYVKAALAVEVEVKAEEKEIKMDADDKKKKILALSKANYRSVTIFELEDGFAFFIGLLFCKYHTLPEVTSYIDTWFDLKKN